MYVCMYVCTYMRIQCGASFDPYIHTLFNLLHAYAYAYAYAYAIAMAIAIPKFHVCLTQQISSGLPGSCRFTLDHAVH